MPSPLVPDALWRDVAPLLPPEAPKPQGGRPRVPDRAALTGIVFVLRSGIPWRMLPPEMGCGSGVTCWRRLRDWQTAGVWDRLHRRLLNNLGARGRIDWSRASLDSAVWAALCPGNNESGGKRLSGRRRKGNPWLRSVLVEAAQAAGRTRGSVLRAQHQRLTARIGSRRSTVAVAHRLLVIAYHLLRDPAAVYREAAPLASERQRDRARRRLVHRLEALGYRVAVEPTAA